MTASESGIRRRFRSRRDRLRATHSYRYVLALLVLSFFFAAAAPSEAWAASTITALLSITVVVALWASGTTRIRGPALVLAALGIAAVVLEIFTPEASLRGTIWLLNVALALMVIAAVALGVADQREVNRQSVTGAICVYLSIGMLFAFAYGAIAGIGDGPLFAQGTDGTVSIRLYYSYVTLTTLGYGDYTAAGDVARTLSVVEALVGQLYLVTVIALLVARLGRRRPRPRDD